MAVRTDIFFQIFFQPFHPLFVFDLGQGIFHGIDCTVVGEIHLCRLQSIGIDIMDMMFLQFAVIDDFFLLRGQITKRDICPDPHGPNNVFHQ